MLFGYPVHDLPVVFDEFHDHVYSFQSDITL